MARLKRICPIGIPQHIIQRGNNKQICFVQEQDFLSYTEWLNEYSKIHEVDIHAWVLMTNHVHLLVTPNAQNSVSLMMQDLGRRYVRYFNKAYQRSGTLWEGRFKSCLVQTEIYLLRCYRYIELNPVRAAMVERPEDYRWSSYRSNGAGEDLKLITPHEEYLSLGKTKEKRMLVYRLLFDEGPGENEKTDIRNAVKRGLAFGSEKFKSEMEALTERRLKMGKPGRPSGL